MTWQMYRIMQLSPQPNVRAFVLPPPQIKAGIYMWSLSTPAPAPSKSNIHSFFILGTFYIKGMIAHMYDFGDWLLSLNMVVY